MSLRRRLAIAGFLAAVVVPVVAAPVAGLATIRFNVDGHSPCLSGYGPVSSSGTASLLDSSSVVVDSDPITSDGSGYWYTPNCFTDVILPGMKVRASFGPQSRTVTVPSISMRIQRATDVFNGRAPASASLVLQVTSYSGFASYTSHTVNITSTASGTWSKDITATVNVHGGDYARISHTNASGDEFYVYEYVPNVRVRLGVAEVTGMVLTGSVVHATLRTSGGSMRGTAGLVGTDNGYGVTGRWTTSTGLAVAAAAGNVVESDAGTDGTFTVGNVTAAVTTGTDVVAGACIASRPYMIEVIHTTPYSNKQVTGTCGAGGTYSRDVTSTVNIVAGDRVTVSSKLTSGDVVQRRAYAP